MARIARGITASAVILLGMSGLRPDRRRKGASFLLWAAAWIGCLVLYTLAFHGSLLGGPEEHPRLALFYLGLVCLLYYGGLFVTLGTPVRRWLIARLGASRAFVAAEAVLGILFLNQALCQTAVMEQFAGTLPPLVPPWLYVAAGATLAAGGLACKFWATALTGLDTYYYRDLFVGRGNGGQNNGFVVRGPYRYLRNPMYGVGNLTAYGMALWYGSAPGLAAAGVMQGLIFLFYILVERPFIARTYFAEGKPPRPAVPKPQPLSAPTPERTRCTGGETSWEISG